MQDKTSINDNFDFIELIKLFKRNIFWILGISTFFMLSSLVVALLSKALPPEKSFLPDVYSPKSIVMINSNSSGGGLDSLLGSSGMSSIASLTGLGGNEEGVTDSKLAITLVNTETFIQKIADEFNLYDVYKLHESDYPKTDLRFILSEKLKVSLNEDSGMLEIMYTDIDKHLATSIVDKVTNLLEESFAEIDLIRNKSQLSLAMENKINVENEINRLQLELLSFQNKHNLMDVDSVFREMMSQKANLQSQLLAVEVKINSHSKTSSIKDPLYLKLITERDTINDALNRLETGEFGGYPPLSDLPKLALELEFLKRELEVQSTVYKTIITQLETLKLTASGTGPTFQVIEHANVPEIKSGPSRSILLILVTMAGFFFSILFVFIKEMFLNIIRDTEKMKRLKGNE